MPYIASQPLLGYFSDFREEMVHCAVQGLAGQNTTLAQYRKLPDIIIGAYCHMIWMASACASATLQPKTL